MTDEELNMHDIIVAKALADLNKQAEEMRAELAQLREDYNALETRVFILELDAPE